MEGQGIGWQVYGQQLAMQCTCVCVNCYFLEWSSWRVRAKLAYIYTAIEMCADVACEGCYIPYVIYIVR